MRSLKGSQHELSNVQEQLRLISSTGLPSFEKKLTDTSLYPLKPLTLDTLQVNLGKMCNQVCKHCHVDAGPDRKEIMTKETMQQILEQIKISGFNTIDLTGGAPELNPDFRWFVEEISKLGKHIIVRCNLTIIVSNPRFNDLPEFFRKHKIELISSLPYFSAGKTDAQRGEGVFERSMKALKMLNDAGYGKSKSEQKLNLVYNPAGAFLPASQESLELEFKQKLKDNYGISFDRLYTITNLPISRYLEYLIRSGNYMGYMEKLVNSFNPDAASNVMCRSMISVGWDGYLYDCDFNQMLDLKIAGPKHISEFDPDKLLDRNIITSQHCYGCTAGAGSSCGGATT